MNQVAFRSKEEYELMQRIMVQTRKIKGQYFFESWDRIGLLRYHNLRKWSIQQLIISELCRSWRAHQLTIELQRMTESTFRKQNHKNSGDLKSWTMMIKTKSSLPRLPEFRKLGGILETWSSLDSSESDPATLRSKVGWARELSFTLLLCRTPD